MFYSQFRKDVSLPQQLQRAMATEAEASREGKIHFNRKINSMKIFIYRNKISKSNLLSFVKRGQRSLLPRARNKHRLRWRKLLMLFLSRSLLYNCVIFKLWITSHKKGIQQLFSQFRAKSWGVFSSRKTETAFQNNKIIPKHNSKDIVKCMK